MTDLRFVLWGFVLATGGCATTNDAVSRQVVAVTHLATEPSGTLSVSDDKSYEFLAADGHAHRQGSLSDADFDALVDRTQNLDSLYAEARPVAEDCLAAEDGYQLQSKHGTACFQMSTMTSSDSEARASLQFFMTVYDQESKP